MDTEALAGFGMPARALTFNSIDCTISLGGSGGPLDAENRRFSELTCISENEVKGLTRADMDVGCIF